MAHLFNRELSRSELHDRLGHLQQAGGIKLCASEDGPDRGVRWLEFRTGSGLIFKAALERGFDVGQVEYKGLPVGWTPPTLFPGPWFFEQQTGFGWLRTAMGGFCNTCGLVHIGNPESDDVSGYDFPARSQEQYGVHDRIAMTPAQLVHCGERWEGDECTLEAGGRLVQSQAYGENLVLTRRLTARLGESRFFIHDEVVNEGSHPTPHMLLYHINIGFPFVDDGARLLGSFEKEPMLLAGDAGAVERGEYRRFSAPKAGAALQVFDHALKAGSDGTAGAAIFNPRLGAEGVGVYIRFNSRQLPKFLQSCWMSPQSYFASLEPASNGFGRQELRRSGGMIVLQPGETRRYDLEAGIVDGKAAAEAFEASFI